MTALKGKTALITGSTSGIGLGVANALAAEGVNVVLNGFGDANEIEKIRATIESTHNVRAIYHGADMSKREQIQDLCKVATATFGSVDILVNNAGIQFVSPIDEFPDDKWDAIIAINLSSAFHTTKALLPGMRKSGWGRIINIASAHGLIASPFKGAYVAAKHGIIGLTKTVALETATDNITCNAICPGYVLTPLVEGQIKDQAKAHNLPESEVVEKIMLAPQPTKKFITVEDIGALSVFLCSNAAQNMTGASLPIDGAWTAR
jgi:3-hydroxybutyrate dehydrogenase